MLISIATVIAKTICLLVNRQYVIALFSLSLALRGTNAKQTSTGCRDFKKYGMTITASVVLAFLVGGVLILLLSQAVWAERYVPYKDYFTPFEKYEVRHRPAEGRGTYTKDPNIWVYTTEFAERFGMPEKWIDDSLKGAEALAYRVESTNTLHCGFFGEVDNCTPNSFFILDVYLSDEDGDKLPWLSKQASEWNDWDSSIRHLSIQRTTDWRYYYDNTKGKDSRYLYRGSALGSISWVSGPPYTRRDGKHQVFTSSGDGSVRLRSYRRDFYQGLDLLSFRVYGMANNTDRPLRIYFMGIWPNMHDVQYRLPDGSINSPKINAAEKKYFANMYSGNVPHKIILPDTYMDKVNAYDRTQYQQPPSVVDEAMRRLRGGKVNGNYEAKPSLWQRFLDWLP